MSPMFWIGYYGNNELTNHVTFNPNSNLKQIFEISTNFFLSAINKYEQSLETWWLLVETSL